MHFLNREEIRRQINQLAAADVPHLFLLDFKGEKGIVVKLEHLASQGISCTIDGIERGTPCPTTKHTVEWSIDPIPFAHYRQGFDHAIEQIRRGNSYLLNLTYPTRLHGTIDLPTIYRQAQAHYKFLLPDQFLFYSPEPFIRITDNSVYSFPMKGTLPNTGQTDAKRTLLDNPKELYEHYTIVDLIRNDLAMIATDIEVEAFRYIDTIQTAKGDVHQTSSRIRGTLPTDWRTRLGDLLLTLLPAGSVSGAPKASTLQIIKEAEIDPRGFYTGVMGIYEKGTLDSCVIIRYLERTPDNRYFYRSGGGITALSHAEEEYQELITKIYVPTI